MATATTMCTDFSVFGKAVNARFAEMSKDEVYCTAIPGEDLYGRYLAAFPEGTNPVLRQRTTHDCQTCKSFIRRLGVLVTIKDGRVGTVWENLDLPMPYKFVAQTLDELVRRSPVVSVFRTKERRYGAEYNYDAKTTERYDHFWGDVTDRHYDKDPGAKIGEKKAVFDVMKRGLTEIRPADIQTVLELIDSNGLYRGEEHRPAVQGFANLMTRFWGAGLTDLFAWENLDDRNAWFRNTVIGTLLVDLAEGKDLDQAVKSFETKVAPANYKRPTSVITQRMVDEALTTLNVLDLGGAVARRYARLSDVSVNDVLFVDNDVRVKMKDGIAALLESSVKKAATDLKRVANMPADGFIGMILPTTKSLAVLVENRHAGNFVSLTGADGPERLFKWDNNFAWSYDGDVTDSVKQRVKAAGGKIDCKLRVSLSWFNTDDLDLHALVPGGRLGGGGHIYFRNKNEVLDVDMNASSLTRTPVENLAFDRLADGVYKVWVNQFLRRETTDVGFAIEVEYGGVVHEYSYPRSQTTGEDVQCFELHCKGGELVKIETTLTGGATSREKWGVKTQTLVPVSLVAYSPNHWGDNRVGAKHLIFVLDKCLNPGSTRGIYNEFLRPEFEKHRKVFEVLGSKTKCPPSTEQLSGVGFTNARGDTVTVVVDGERAYTLTF